MWRRSSAPRGNVPALADAPAPLTKPAFRLAVAKDIATFWHDPLGYVRYAFPWGQAGTELARYSGPRKWQVEFLTNLGQRLRAGETLRDAMKEVIQEATVSGHGVGKSALVAWIILWALSTLEDTRVLVTANTDKQLQTKTSPEIAKWHRLAINHDWFTYTTTSLYSSDAKHEKNWRCDLTPWSEHNTEAFAGLHNVGRRIVLLFDEASKIADKVWEVAEGALTDEGTEIMWLVFGNGTQARGRFRECFRRYRHRWHGRHLDSRTVEGTNKQQLDKWVEDYGEDSDFVKVRVRGLFPNTSFKQYFDQADIDAAYGRKLPGARYEFAPKIITVDPAWEGDDEFVIGIRQGLWFEILATYPKNDNDVEMANIIMRLEDEEQADAVFVDGGFGTGIISVARTLGRDWTLVWFGGKAYDDGCVNKRAEMYKLTKQWLKEGGSVPDDPVLLDEFSSIEAVPRMDGKLLIESKLDMKARDLPSPNRLDALVLSFAHPVVKRQRNGGTKGKVKHDWDPLSRSAA